MSAIVRWDSSFSVGHDEMDRQHQRLLGLCNEMAEHAAGTLPVSRARFHDILNELSLYSRQHFQEEEALLQKMRYANLEEQENEHRAYDEKIADWAFDATMGTLDMKETHAFLARWWTNHILVSDMKYRALLESRR